MKRGLGLPTVTSAGVPLRSETSGTEKQEGEERGENLRAERGVQR